MTARPGGSESDSFGPSDKIPVYILAGGKSRRYGSDKARALRAGEPLIVRVARELERIASRTTVVAGRAGDYDDFGLRTIGDVVPDKGPMGGLLTAIEDCGEEDWLLLVACDWVGIRAGWVRLLLESRQDSSQAVVFRSDRNEPLFSLYHTSILDVTRRQIEAGRLAMQEVIERVAAVVVPAPDGWSDVLNLNEPPDHLP